MDQSPRATRGARPAPAGLRRNSDSVTRSRSREHSRVCSPRSRASSSSTSVPPPPSPPPLHRVPSFPPASQIAVVFVVIHARLFGVKVNRGDHRLADASDVVRRRAVFETDNRLKDFFGQTASNRTSVPANVPPAFARARAGLFGILSGLVLRRRLKSLPVRGVN